MIKCKKYFIIFLGLFFHVVCIADDVLLTESLVRDNQNLTINDVLIEAVKKQNVKVVKKCIEHGATNLHEALEIAKELKNDEIIILLKTVIQSLTKSKNTFLSPVVGGSIAFLGCLGFFYNRYLLNTEAEILLKHHQGEVDQALISAFSQNKNDLFNSLIGYAKTKDLNNTLMYAVRNNNKKLIEKMLQQAVTNKDEAFAELLSCKDKLKFSSEKWVHKANVEAFIYAGISDYNKALMYMAFQQDKNLIEHCIQKGAFDYTAALNSLLANPENNMVKSYQDLVQFFIDKGANISNEAQVKIDKLCLFDKNITQKDSSVLSEFDSLVNRSVYSMTEGILKEKLQEKKQLTATEQHLLKILQDHPGAVLNMCEFFESLKDSKSDTSTILLTPQSFHHFCDIIDKAAKHERKMEAEGWTTFYHARHSGWGFVSRLSSIMDAINADEDKVDFIPKLRARSGDIDVEKLYKWRKQLKSQGVMKHIASASNHNGPESEVTFMTRTPMTNITLKGECPLYYALKDHSCSGGVHPLDIAYRLSEEEDEVDIKNLYNLYQEANDENCGEILMISCKNDDSMNNIIFPARAGGFKYTNKGAFEENSKIRKEIKNPSNKEYGTPGNFITPYDLQSKETVFCLCVSDIPGDTSYKIQSINQLNSHKFNKAYQQKEKEFIKKLQQRKQANYSMTKDFFIQAL